MRASLGWNSAIPLLALGYWGCTKPVPAVLVATPPPASPLAAQASALAPVLSGNLPSEVTLPPGTWPPESLRPFFDYFSWETFIALVWPVDPNQRGVPLNPNDPNAFLSMQNTAPSVWTSYKNQWDLFGQGANRPSPWSSSTDPINPCPTPNSTMAMGHVFGLGKGAAEGGPVTDMNEAFSVPLVDQWKNYALYEIRYNQTQYEFVRGADADQTSWLYLKKNLVAKESAGGGSISMPSSQAPSTQGSIMAKASWRVLGPKDDASRYYVIDQVVFDPVTQSCVKEKLGLIGLHMVRKVKGFSQWIWSSFEQVDNVPGAANAKAPYTFNNGQSTPVTDRGYANKPGQTGPVPISQRVPVQVTRFNPIPTTPAVMSTVDINALFQKAVGKSWAQYYQLVITQWPTDDTKFKVYGSGGGIYPQDSGVPFPTDSCANTTLETYFQSRMDASTFGNSCMSCHFQASSSDFSWSLFNRSH